MRIDDDRVGAADRAQARPARRRAAGRSRRTRRRRGCARRGARAARAPRRSGRPRRARSCRRSARRCRCRRPRRRRRARRGRCGPRGLPRRCGRACEGPGTCARACNGRSPRTPRPCPDAAHAPPTAPRGSRSSRSAVRCPRLGSAQPEHRRELEHDLLLHLAGRRAGVERMIVRVHQHRRDVAGGGRGVRRLEHLARVARVEERDGCRRPCGARTPPTPPPSGRGRPGGPRGRSPQRASHDWTRSSAAPMPERIMRGIMPGGRCSARSSRLAVGGCGAAAAAPLRDDPAPAAQSVGAGLGAARPGPGGAAPAPPAGGHGRDRARPRRGAAAGGQAGLRDPA